ncbi:hypothetical protein ACE01N_11260 [Saccharicrinis sp. FJH2]|uniref:hypothetical protein n=1 Tax=Saccharicrinis sp. FJH65 TaxID=3344659 RepID=UPI0035F4EC24
MRLKLYIALILGIFMLSVQAQTKVKVLTRIIEKSYTYSDEFLLEIDAEKADITIETISGNTVELQLKQIVKNSSQEIAEDHLKAQKFVENSTKERLFLKNYILFNDANDKSGSIFKNEYILKVPEWCHVKIKNQLGNIVLKKLDKGIMLDLEYAKAELDDCTSQLNANISLGELTVIKGTITGSINTRNTRIKLQSVSGDISGTTTLGNISLFLNGNPLVTDLQTNYCETTIINKSEGSYSFDLETKGGKINSIEHEAKKTDLGEKLLIAPETDGVLPQIKITATDNDINLY